MSELQVAFAGLGAMGYPMAGRIAARFPTSVWNRTASVADRHSAEFGTKAAGLAALGVADVVISCLASSAVVATVVDRALPDLRTGTVWVDCTSGRPGSSRDIAARLAAAGVSFLDAPVSGMAHGARAGALTALVGGPEATLERVRPVLDAVCGRILHTGGPGTGYLVKAANNALFAGAFWLAAEVLGGLRDAGVDPARALECVNASSGRSFVTEQFLPDFVIPSAAPSSYRLAQSGRDVETFLEALPADGWHPTLLSALASGYAELIASTGSTVGAAQAFDAIGPA